MKRLTLLITLTLLLFGVSLAETTSQNEPLIHYITRYQLASNNEPIYGLFDLGEKPSIRITTTGFNGGTLTLELHGRHYFAPILKSFSLSAAFEDVTGRIFEQSFHYTFVPPAHASNLQWFTNLENIAGFYGNQKVDIKVPPGTSVINLAGDDAGNAESPNQLIGYISHIRLP